MPIAFRSEPSPLEPPEQAGAPLEALAAYLAGQRHELEDALALLGGVDVSHWTSTAGRAFHAALDERRRQAAETLGRLDTLRSLALAQARWLNDEQHRLAMERLRSAEAVSVRSSRVDGPWYQGR
ncbi:hypothetical protein [Arthrobacter sp. NPDC090010]|uniref:hypothetical protein n=1 Tax=Arthrobacter sp. NPDC090010 TaxID=3363942 RepID=UPI0038066FB4